MTERWKRLKSGSDIRGVAVAEENAQAELTEDVGVSVGRAFARWLGARTGKAVVRIAVGRDSRVTGEALEAAMMRGLSFERAEVMHCGLCTTPAMFMTTVLAQCDGAVMVTASHLPWQRNGYKFFTAEGGLESGDILTLLEAASFLRPDGSEQPPTEMTFLDDYTAFLSQYVRTALDDAGDAPLEGLHVVVDAGNGAGGFYARMLKTLGACVDGSQFLEPDGRFPNHIPNPEDAHAMESLCAAVRSAGADLGVIFDADCDRAALVDGEGRAINRNRLIALISAVLLRESPGATIVTDSVVSAGLDDFLSAHGGTLHRFKRGYKNVIDEARRLCGEGTDCPLAIETSGHAALRENHFLDDGMYLATRLIVEAVRCKRAGTTLCSLIASLAEPREAAEVRMTLRAADFRAAGEAILAHVEQAAAAREGWAVDSGNREGVRVLCGAKSEWCLLRLSVHDPLLVLNAESDRCGGVAAMLRALREMLGGQSALDISALDARLTENQEGESNA